MSHLGGERGLSSLETDRLVDRTWQSWHLCKKIVQNQFLRLQKNAELAQFKEGRGQLRPESRQRRQKQKNRKIETPNTRIQQVKNSLHSS